MKAPLRDSLGSTGGAPRSDGGRSQAAGGRTARRLIVGITGATGSIYGIRLLEVLRGTSIETHLVVSRWGARTLIQETPFTLEQVRGLAARSYSAGDQGAALASGSFLSSGMVIAPCSMRSLSAIAHGLGDNLIHRAADVVLKERHRLVLLVREAPLSDVHLENMLKLSRMGAVICPPVPAFYQNPRTIDDLVNHTVQRVLDLFDIHLEVAERWNGLAPPGRRLAPVRRKVVPMRSRPKER